MSRNTVKRYLRNAVLEPRYSRRLPQPQPKLGEFIAKLEELLSGDEKRPLTCPGNFEPFITWGSSGNRVSDSESF